MNRGGRKKLKFSITIPESFTSKKYRYEVYLYNENKKLAENYYNIYTLPLKTRIKKFPKKRVALYDLVEQKYGGLGVKSTVEVLNYLNIPYHSISDLKELSKYEVLIIGANSFDSNLVREGGKIAEWIRKGGRLLCFEQSRGGAVPWDENEIILSKGKSHFMEIYYKKHPIFKEVEDEMQWENPYGKARILFQNCLKLNDSFLALASVAHFADTTGIQSVINNRKVEKGEYLISMVLTAELFNIDSTITKYVENLLAYILSDNISPYAIGGDITVSSSTKKKMIMLDRKDAHFIDLTGAVNKGFVDDIPADKNGGWTDYGSGACMKNLEVEAGITSLNGYVPFNIINPSKNSGKSCIVLKGPTRDYFPSESKQIPVDRELERLYFLHTLMYVNAKDGETVMKYEVTYEDGKKKIAPMKNLKDNADWWRPKDHLNAQIVYIESANNNALYLTEWINPNPKKKIESIRALSTGNAIPIVVAITGKKRFKQLIDKVE
ncbi:hypothetical protein ACFL6D_03645 [Spirochaetota bacterium]